MHVNPHERAARYAIFDRFGNLLVDVNNHEEATILWKWGKDAGSGSMVLPADTDPELIAAALRVHDYPLFISVYTPAPEPWTGRVSNGEYVDDGDGPRLELTLVHDRIWLDAMLAVANPAQPPGQQDRESDVREGPLVNVVKDYLTAAAGRLGVPVMVTGTTAEDTSPIVKLSARMVTMSSLFEDVLDRYGYSVTARTYRYGDPQPAGTGFTPEPGTVILDVIPGRDNERLLWQQEHLATFSVSSTEPQAYRAYVGLKGEGVDRPFLEVVDTAARERMNNRGLPEIFVDVTDENADPQQKAADELRKVAGGLSVSFTVSDGTPWYLGDDWLIGDMAHARIAGQVFSARIVEVEMNESAGQPVTFTPTCGVADPARPEAVADAVARLAADIRSRNARR